MARHVKPAVWCIVSTIVATMGLLLEAHQRHSKGIVIQQFDFSCGAASLVMLLRDSYGADLTEQEVLKTIWEDLSIAAIDERRRDGLTLLDLKHAADALGCTAIGARFTVTAVSPLPAPVLVRLDVDGAGHFAVVRKIVGQRVEIADPVRGNLQLSLAELTSQWDGTALIITDRDPAPPRRGRPPEGAR